MMSKNIKLIFVLIALLIVGILIWQLKSKEAMQNINSYEDCVAAGYPIMESYPERCSTPDGRTFTRQVAEQDTWIPQTFNKAGLNLAFRTPPDTTLREEVAENAGTIRVASFYVEKGPQDNPTYQLYAVYQPLESVTDEDLEKVKTGMDPVSINEISIDGYEGIEGLANSSDPKAHYSTAIIKDDKMFSVSTWPPTPENKELTDKIIETFDFE